MNIPTEPEEIMNALMEAEGEPEGFVISSLSHKQIDIVRAAIDKEKELRAHAK